MSDSATDQYHSHTLSEKESGSCANLSHIPHAQYAPISGYTIATPGVAPVEAHDALEVLSMLYLLQSIRLGLSVIKSNDI